jgi:hypothetical protein
MIINFIEMYSFSSSKRKNSMKNIFGEILIQSSVVPPKTVPLLKPIPNSTPVSIPIDTNTYLNNFVATPTNPNPSLPTQYFNGIQLKTLYNVPNIPVVAGKKQVLIAIIIAYSYPNLIQDLKKYWQNCSNFGSNSNPPTVNVHTMPGATFNAGWAVEECLDVQMVCTINPNANIWVVEAKSSSTADLLAAVQYANITLQADVLSMSWGGNDGPFLSNTVNNSYFTDASKCYCASSGDSNTVSWPAVSTNCIAVGGTTLLWTPNAPNQRTEFTWVNAGSGYSITFPTPSYQSQQNTNAKRCIPDISLIAGVSSLVYIYCSCGTNNPWIPVSGTSVSSPIFAAIVSIADQGRFNQGKSALTSVYSKTPLTPNTSISPSNSLQNYLYKTILTHPSEYSADFNDITIGNDTAGGSSPIYNAATGFDVATGIGSPNVAAFCADLLNI